MAATSQVVENLIAAKDGIGAAEEYLGEALRLIELDETGSFSPLALNSVKEARGHLLAYLDNSTRGPGLIEHLISAVQPVHDLNREV